MTREGVEAGKGHITIGLNDQTKKALANIRRNLNKWSKSLAVSAAAIGAPLLAAAKSFASTGDAIGKMAKRTGLTTDEVQEFTFAMEQSGASVQALEPGIKGMNRNLLDMSRDLTTAKDNFKDLGLNFDEFMNLGTSGRLKAILNALGEIEDEGMRAALAQKFLGRSGPALLPLIGNVEELVNEYKSMGVAMDAGQIEQAEEMTDAFNRLSHQMKAIAINVGSAIVPSLMSFAEQMGPVIKSAVDWVKENQWLIKTLGGIAVALGTVSVAMKALALTNPFTAALVGAAAIVANLEKVSEFLNRPPPAWVQEMNQGLKTGFGAIPEEPVKDEGFVNDLTKDMFEDLNGFMNDAIWVQRWDNVGKQIEDYFKLGQKIQKEQTKKAREDNFAGFTRKAFNDLRLGANKLSAVVRNAGALVGSQMELAFGGSSSSKFDPRTTTVGGFGAAFGATAGAMRRPEETQEEILAEQARTNELLTNIERSFNFFGGK